LLYLSVANPGISGGRMVVAGFASSSSGDVSSVSNPTPMIDHGAVTNVLVSSL